MARRSTSQDPGSPVAPKAPQSAPQKAEKPSPPKAEPSNALAAKPAGTPPAARREFVGFTPSPYQQRLKTKYWSLLRDQPLLSQDSISTEQMGRLVGDASVTVWCKDPAFRAWFLNEQTFRQDMDWLCELWMTQAGQLMLGGYMQTKDFIALGNLLMRLSGRDGKALPEDKAPESVEDSKRAIIKAGKLLGMEFPKAPGLETLDAELKEVNGEPQ